MSTLRSAIWRIAQSTTECKCAICTSCTGSGRIASPGSPAAGRQPSSSPPAQQQPASPAAARQPSSSPPARQQAASRQQAARPAADHRPGSYVIYAPARAGAHAPRRSNVPACVRGRAGTARAPAGYAGSEARKLGRFVIFFGISVWAGRKKWGLKLSSRG